PVPPPAPTTLSLHDALPIWRRPRTLVVATTADGRWDDETMDTADTAYAPQPHGSQVPVGLRAPFSGRTWREFLHLLLSLPIASRSEEHTSELQSLRHLVCRL